MSYGRLLIVGEAPSSRGNGVVLGELVGRRLAEAGGISLDDYLERTDRVNLFQRPLARWDRVGARFHASLVAIDRTRRVILLGRRVAAAFSLAHLDVLRWYGPATTRLAARSLAIVPHPSGRNRWWNDPANRIQAERFLRTALREREWSR